VVDRAQDPRFSRGQPSAPADYSSMPRQDVATDVYRAFREAGFSDAQAQALTAEVNRENSLRSSFLFGSHTDPYNEARNVGMLSFQGPRAPAVLGFLRERGVADEAGNITPGYDALVAQAEFIRQEMETDPLYEATRTTFLNNPDIDPATAHRVLGDDYVRWRRTDPTYRDSGYERIGEGYALLTGEGGDAGSLVTGGVRPLTRPREEQAENKSFLDLLPEALQYLDASQLAQAPRYRFDPPAIRRPAGGSGTQALQRMGIASLV
jgi:hypothetical protein